MGFVNRLLGFASPGKGLRRGLALRDKGRAVEAFPLLHHAARAGIPEAEHAVARCYLEGSGVPVNRTEGGRWLLRAAENGWTEAQVLLATLCIHGVVDVRARDKDEPQGNRLFAAAADAKPDFDTALKWARLAAESGSPKGLAILGYILTWGPATMRDPEAARAYYRQSAAALCPEGCLGYALSLAPSAANAEDHRQIVELLYRAASAGLATAIYLLGVFTEQGVGVERNPPVAAQLYRHAAERSHRAAQTRWGLALMTGRDVARDVSIGETWLRRAALAGDADAAALVGDLCIRNGSLPPNYTEAATWYLRAAEAGHSAAARALGSLYLTGAGVGYDAAEAARWLRISATAGDQVSQVDLANLVLRGAGDPQDEARVAEWFGRAAASGDLVAAYNFGLCHVKGVGVERDERQAAQWLRRAAERVPEAQFIYGRMLAEGLGMEANAAEARQWMARAANSGILDAEVALGEMLVNGRGGPYDTAAAFKLFETAASKDHSGAMFALGAMYGGGHGLAADQAAAEHWFRAAADRGHGQAQLMLGRYLANGTDGPRDAEEARNWLRRATAQGIAGANEDLAALEGTLALIRARPETAEPIEERPLTQDSPSPIENRNPEAP